MALSQSSLNAAQAVLVVDDDSDYRALVALCFEQLGYATLTANDGVDALNIVCTEPRKQFYAVWTDVHMPRMDGIMLAQSLRALGYEFPIILSSGSLERSGYTRPDVWQITPHYAEKFGSLDGIREFIRQTLN